MREVSEGIYALDGLKTGRAYLVADRDALTLVDTSTSGVAEKILGAIDAIGRRPQELRTIVATHYHHDHTGNVMALIDRTGAQLYAHADEAPYIDGRKPWGTVHVGPFDMSVPEARQFALHVDRELRAGDELPFAGGVTVLHTPGHTPGSISLHARSRGVLFAGDALGNYLGLRLPLSMSSHDMDAAKRSVHALAALAYEVALPGHGHPIVGRASEKIALWAKRWL